MGGLFGAGNTNAAKAPRYTQMQLQSSAYGAVVPIIYGTTRVGWNLGDYVNFKATKQKAAGGKGGVIGGGGKGSQSVSYSASVLGFLGEGPIGGVNSSWISQTQTPGAPGFTIFDGAIAQAAWTYLEDNFPTHAIGYSGLAYAAAQDYDLGSSANLPNVNWEVLGIFEGTAPGTYGGNGCMAGGDADPSLVVKDLLTNAQYGAGFPANRVGQVINNNEAHSVPGSIPYTVAVTNAAGYLYNLNIARASDGQLLTCVAGVPSSGLEYSYNAVTGVYTFHSAAAGLSMNIRYASIEALVDYQNFTLAAGLWISPAYTDQVQTSSMLDDLGIATFSEFVWSSGVLTVVPRASAPVSGNSHTYTPPSSPLFALTYDDFLENTSPIGTASSGTSDAVIVSRKRKSDQINDIKIEAFDRANQYAPTVVEAMDQALIDAYGRRAGSSKSLHMFCDVTAANTSAQLQLQDQYILNSYSFQLDERFLLLDPMDMVELTDPNFPGMTNISVRLLEIQENDDGTFSMAAEEYPGSIGVIPAYSVDVGSGLIQDFNVDPGDAATPAIFDVPVQLAQTIGLETWLATHSATGNPDWGGCEIWVSSDNVHFNPTGEIIGASRMGVLTAGLASGSDPDTTHTLSVDLTESLGELDAVATADADRGDSVCFVDGEYISYSAVTLTGTNQYNLGTYLRRGQWGSQIASHLTGSLFVRLDDSVFKLPYSATDVGRTIHIKLLSFNIYGGGKQALSDVSSFSHTIGGPPTIYAPTSLTIIPTLKGNQLTWVNAPNVGIAAVEIWRSTTSSFGAAAKIADAASYATSFLDQSNTSSGTQYWYWIRCRDIAGNEGDYDPSNGGAGATGTTLQVGTGDIGNGAVTGSKIAAGAVDGTKFASGLTGVELFSALPTTGNFEGRTVLNTTDGKLYRYHFGAFTALVPAVDISGQLTDAQLAAIAAAKVTGQLTDSQIAAIAAAKITGQITTTQITDNSISTPKLQAGSVTTNELATGSVVTGKLAAGAVTAAKADIGDLSANILTVGSILTGMLAAGAVTAAKADIGDLSTNILTSGSIQAGMLDVDAVTAGTLAVGAVNAGAIIVNDILVTGHLVANAVTNPNVATGGTTTLSQSSGSPTTLLSITITTVGGQVMCDFTDWFARSGGHSPSAVYSVVGPNGVIVSSSNGGSGVMANCTSAGSGLDTSVAGVPGTYTWTLQAYVNGGDPACVSEQPFLRITEVKK